MKSLNQLFILYFHDKITLNAGHISNNKDSCSQIHSSVIYDLTTKKDKSVTKQHEALLRSTLKMKPWEA